MGNTLGIRSKTKATTKIMKINGETTKLKTPVQAMEVTDRHQGHVLLDSESVKRFGIRAKPLEPAQFLEPKRLYFLVELPKFSEDHHKAPRRVRSGGIHVSAKDRLESLMLSRRSVSDLSTIKNKATDVAAEVGHGSTVRMKLPRAEVERLVRQSKDEAEAAQKIMGLCMGNSGPVKGQTSTKPGLEGKEVALGLSSHQETSNKKRVGFLPVNEVAEIGLTIDSR